MTSKVNRFVVPTFVCITVDFQEDIIKSNPPSHFVHFDDEPFSFFLQEVEHIIKILNIALTTKAKQDYYTTRRENKSRTKSEKCRSI